MDAYSACDIERVVKDALGFDNNQMITTTQLGWLAFQNANLLPGPEYFVSFNFARKSDETKYISQFIRTADRETVMNFYRYCNGMKVFNFSVPGIGFTPIDCSGLDFHNLPYEMQTMGGLLLPKYSPVEGFLIGCSDVVNTTEKTRTLYDVVDERGSIYGGYFDEDSAIESEFQSIEAWLSMRVADAKRRHLSVLRNSLN